MNNGWFMGLSLVLGHLKAAREERGPPYAVEHMNKLGTSREVHTALGNSEIRSMARVGGFDLNLDSIGH